LGFPFVQNLQEFAEKLVNRWKWGGHDFSRAGKPFIFVIPSGLQPARNLLF
jgi:ligand-binding sensor protein